MDLLTGLNSILHESTLDAELSSKFGIDQQQASMIVRGLDFSTFLQVQDALVSGDDAAVADLLGIRDLQQEETNAYTAARTGTAQAQANTPQDDVEANNAMSELKVGSEVPTDKGDAKITRVDKLGDTTTYTTDKSTQMTQSDNIQPPRGDLSMPDEAEEEIARIRQLAGIEEPEVTENGVGSGKPGGFRGGALASAALSGAVMSKGKIDRYTHKEQKPGPTAKKKR